MINHNRTIDMSKQAAGGTSDPLPNNFSAKKPADASAPRVGPYTVQTSQSNKRGKQG